MGKQIPNWLFGVIIVAFTVGILGLLGTAVKPKPAPGTTGSMIGKTAPECAGETTDGKQLKLSDYKGKVVLVNFWATWCGPCRMELPDLVKLQSEFGSKGFTVIGLSRDTDIATANTFAKEQKLNYPILKGTDDIMVNFGSPDGIPASYLVGKDGKVVWEQDGVDPTRSTYSILKPEIESRL
jgi:cytochrome c biogenesis protein CcmG/thiol:disulfide interchange protein DsbE